MSSNASEKHRLYCRATITGYRRGGPSNGSHKNHVTLMTIEGVHSKDDAQFYAGKRVAYIYKVCKAKTATLRSSSYKVLLVIQIVMPL